MKTSRPNVTSIVASRILSRPGCEPSRGAGTIFINDGLIERIIASEADGDGVVGHGLLAMPALGNAHDHGRGVKFLSFGAKDDRLETWVPAFYARPDVDPYLNAALIMGRFAQSGIGSAIHCHQTPSSAAQFEPEIVAAARAADDVGIRLGLVVPMRDRNRLCYGSDEALLSLLAPDDREGVVANWLYDPVLPKEQVARVERLASMCDSELVQIQYGPVGVQWASNELLELIAAASEQHSRRVHMHLLETKRQREWLDAAYPSGIIDFLDRIGLLSPRLSVAHGVWLRSDELDRLAERGVIVSLNTSSNLRLGSGIAPAREMIARGVAVGLGLDGLALDDDDDALREMRLTDVLHRGPGFAEDIPRETLFAASMAVAPRAVTGRSEFGQIAPGKAADVVTLDYGAMTRDVIDGLLDESELVLARGTARYVHSLVVAGREVLRDGRVLGIDIAEAERELLGQVAATKNTLPRQREIIGRYQDALKRYYMCGRHRELGCDAPASGGGGLKGNPKACC